MAWLAARKLWNAPRFFLGNGRLTFMPKSRDNLVWIDCEMTGLDPATDVLIEIAAAITDEQLNVLAKGPDIVIHRAKSVMDAMDSWNRSHHRKSGLTEAVLNSTVSEEDAEQDVLKFVRKHCYKGTAPLCGNSVGQDRRFLDRYMPRLHAYFHYQSIDVSSIKQVARRWYPGRCTPPEKSEQHRALDDIFESIEELRYYKKHIFKRPR